MNRPVTALLAALDAVIVVAIGVGIPLIPLTILWATQFGLAVDWLAFWRASADLWLLGNGVDLLLTVDPDLALRLALEGAGVPFEIGIAPLGLALITVLLGVRAGRRLSATPYPVTAAVVGAVAVGALSLLVCLSAREAAALPSVLQSILFPAGVYALGMAVGTAWTARRAPALELGPSSGVRRRWRTRIEQIDEGDRGLVGLVLRAGALAAAGVMALSAIAMALILVFNFSSIVSLYESLQAGLVGGISLTVAQLALLPNMIIWTASWFVGPGFAIGAGSAVSPLGTQLGLVPALPVLGALPQGTPALGFVGLLVPVVIGFATAAVLRPSFLGHVRGRHGRGRIVRMVIVAAGAGAVGASILGLLALWSGGAAGPGRLAEVGPDAGWVWLWAFVEFTIPMLLGLVAGATSRSAVGRERGGEAGVGAGAATGSAFGAGPGSTGGSEPFRTPDTL